MYVVSGKNIVLLHGWGASVKKLNPLKRKLEDLGWNVFVPKIPGFDGKPPNDPWDLSDYAGYVVELADKKFKKDYVLFGHSFGGRVAVKAASTKKGVAGMVLCSSGGFSRSNPVKRYMFMVLSKLGKGLLVFPPLAGAFRKLLYKLAREHDYEKTKGVMRDTFKNIVGEDLTNIVQYVKVPTLILWGRNDKMTPFEDAELINSKVRKSKLVAYDNIGHKLPYEKPGGLAKEIQAWHQEILKQ